MAYQALYRQWRPRDFSHMVGQQAVIETLRHQVVSNRIAHAYLFCGSRGTGKTSTAKILAKAVNCENPQNGDPCGACPNCLRADNDETLDIMEIDAASNNGVDEIRDLRDTVKYPPQFGNYKVYIIDEVHMLSPSAFNALLKTLEEPPAHIVFILATTEPQKLPATILSRCQRFDFGRISVPEITGRLREAVDGAGGTATDGALMLIARAAEGGMRDALSILDMCLGYGGTVDEALVHNVLGTSDRGFLFRFAEVLADGEPGPLFGMIDELIRTGRDPAVFARDMSGHIRSLLAAKCCPDALDAIEDLTKEDGSEYRRQAERFTLTRLMMILDLYMSMETEMRYSATPRLALESVSLKSCLKTREVDYQALTDRIGELEEKLSAMEKLLDACRNNPALLNEPAAGKKAEAAEKAGTSRSPVFSRERGSAAKQKNLPENEEAVWKELMNRIRKQEPGILGMLSQGKLISAQNNEYLWQANEEGAFFETSLNLPERSQKIARILSEIRGESCSFHAVERPSAGNQDTGEADAPYLQGLYQTFGQGAVDVVDSLQGK